MLKIKEVSCERTYPAIDCGENDIQRLMADSYIATLQKQGVAFDVYNDDVVVAQFMLTMSIIVDEDHDWSRGYNEFLCVKIEYIAVDKALQHRKIGTTMLKYAIKYIGDHIKGLPIRFILIESVQNKVGWYEKFGFRELGEGIHLRSQDKFTVPMYIDFMDYEAVEKYSKSIV